MPIISFFSLANEFPLNQFTSLHLEGCATLRYILYPEILRNTNVLYQKHIKNQIITPLNKIPAIEMSSITVGTSGKFNEWATNESSSENP